MYTAYVENEISTPYYVEYL